MKQFFGLLTTSFIGLSIIMAATGCQRPGLKADKAAARAKEAPLPIPEEVSLQADRSQFAEMRKDIPDDVKRENDELALILELMAKGDEEPGKIRERFNKAMRDKREKNDRILRKERDDFTKIERKKRDEFLRALKSGRETFVKRKGLAADVRTRFFNEQEEKRQTYFNDERDKRKDFESEATEKRRSFEDYARERSNEFNQEHRAYTTNFYERKKALALKKRTEEKAKQKQQTPAAGASLGGAEDPMAEFKNLPQVPTTPLGPSDD